MGQHLSVFQKSRDAGRDAQALGALHETAEQNPLPEDECDTSPLEEIEGVRSSLEKTSAEVWHTGSEVKPDTTSKTLLGLPTELILDLAKYLPPSAYMSLSYSCRDVRNKMSVSFAHVLGDRVVKDLSSDSPPSVELRNTRLLERLELRSMLGRDGRIPLRYVFCNGCGYAHESSHFSPASPPRPHTERRCLGMARKVWICPHRTIDYHQATSRGQTGDSHICGGSFVSVNGRRSGRGFDSCSTDWPIVRVPGDGVLSNEQAAEALSRLSAAVCPHLRLNDACVADVYLQDCRRLRWNWSCTGSPPDCRCSNCSPNKFGTGVCNFCSTKVLFSISNERNGTETLQLIVMRTFREVWSCRNREWISHVAEPADFEEYDREWQASNVECWLRGVIFNDFLTFEIGASIPTFNVGANDEAIGNLGTNN